MELTNRDGTMGTLWHTGIVIWLCMVILHVSKGLPANFPMSSSSISHAVDFLTKYGYLPPSELESGNLRTEEQLRRAVQAMQRFAGITQTGIIDEATLSLMKKKRCGMPDLIGTSERVRRYALQGQKWPKTDLTWSVRETAPNADLSMVRRQLARAFQVWSGASRLTFREVRDPNADIVVSFPRGSHGDGYPFDGEGAVLAHAFFPGEGIGGDAHFDAEEKWIPSQPLYESDGVNLFAVAAHEFGHSLGLSHSSVPGSLMFPYYQALDDRFQLPDDDAEGIRKLYGSDTSPEVMPLPPLPTTFQPPTPSSATPSTRPNPLTTERSKEDRDPRLPPTHSDVPNTCNTSFDAISVIRNEVFVFKGRYFWRLDSNGLKKNYPAPIDRFWYNLPADLERVDAVYERPTDTKILFFSGDRFWLFSANQPEPGYPRPLTDLGLPHDLNRLDAAMVWGHNGKTYFFSGTRYWRFDESDKRVELDYPRDMAMWRGVPYHVDAAFQWTDGQTYFFKGKYFWKFNDAKMKVYENSPNEITNVWFGCPSFSEKLPESNATSEDLDRSQMSSSYEAKVNMWFCLMLVVSNIVRLCDL